MNQEKNLFCGNFIKEKQKKDQTFETHKQI